MSVIRQWADAGGQGNGRKRKRRKKGILSNGRKLQASSAPSLSFYVFYVFFVVTPVLFFSLRPLRLFAANSPQAISTRFQQCHAALSTIGADADDGT